MSRLLCLVLAAGLALPARAMFEEDQSSIRAEGMGGAFTAVADDVSASWYNPAGLYQSRGFQLHGFYKLLYGGVGANLHSTHVGFGTDVRRLGTAVLSMQETGFELHSERTVKLSHGFNLAKDLGFGYGLTGYNLYQRHANEDGTDLSAFGFGFDLGMFARVYRHWTVGFMARNLNRPRIGAGEESEISSSLGFGMGFSPAPGIHSALDVQKEPGKATQIMVGQEFRIIRDHLTVRAGVQTEPTRLSAGLRTGVENVYLDYAVETHPLLPLSHNLGLMLAF